MTIWSNAKISPKWKINKADVISWANQAWKVLVPYLVVIVPVLISQVDKDWAYSAILIYVLNRIWDAARRFTDGK